MSTKEIADIEQRMVVMNEFMTDLLAMHQTMLNHFNALGMKVLELEKVVTAKSNARKLTETATIMRQEVIEERMEEMQRDMGVLHTSMTAILKITCKGQN